MPFWASTNGWSSGTTATTFGGWATQGYVTCTSSASTNTTFAYNHYYNSLNQMAMINRYNSAPRYYYSNNAAPRQAAIVRAHPKPAQDRAQELLLSHLTPEQRATFNKNKWFVVEGGKSKRRYRIRAQDDLIANIDVLDGDRIAHRLCGHCDIRAVPLGDQLLAQKVMIEAAEDDFLKIANRHAA